jgi:hypothetical protein
MSMLFGANVESTLMQSPWTTAFCGDALSFVMGFLFRLK